MRRTLSAIIEWLRVEHRGIPRWFLGFVIPFAAVLIGVLAVAWTR